MRDVNSSVNINKNDKLREEFREEWKVTERIKVEKNGRLNDG